MLGHSYEQMPMHIEQDPEEMIVKTLDALEKCTGQRPIGWLSPGFGETFQTPDHLAGAGLKYTCEWPYDDEPTRISTKHGPLVTLPYPIECQDVTTLAVQTQEAPYFARKCIDAFERLYEESARRTKIFSIAIHPYAAGQPHAIKYLEQIYEHVAKFKACWIWNGRKIYGLVLEGTGEIRRPAKIAFPFTGTTKTRRTRRELFASCSSRPFVVEEITDGPEQFRVGITRDTLRADGTSNLRRSARSSCSPIRSMHGRFSRRM
jgi:hypothetical protein